MQDINKVLLIGRMTRDIGERDYSFTTGGTCRLNISLAVNESVKSNGTWTNKPSYFDVTIWGKPAESLKQYLSKGKQIAVEGRLQQQRWEKDGQKFSKVCVIAESVQLLGGNQSGSSNGESSYNGSSYEPATDVYPEDIPF